MPCQTLWDQGNHLVKWCYHVILTADISLVSYLHSDPVYMLVIGPLLALMMMKCHWSPICIIDPLSTDTADLASLHEGSMVWKKQMTRQNTCCLTYKRISINALAPGKFEWNLRHAICKQILVIDDSGISCEIALIRMSLDFTDDQSGNGSGNGLVLSGNKPLPEPMLTQISVAIWRH